MKWKGETLTYWKSLEQHFNRIIEYELERTHKDNPIQLLALHRTSLRIRELICEKRERFSHNLSHHHTQIKISFSASIPSLMRNPSRNQFPAAAWLTFSCEKCWKRKGLWKYPGQTSSLSLYSQYLMLSYQYRTDVFFMDKAPFFFPISSPTPLPLAEKELSRLYCAFYS